MEKILQSEEEPEGEMSSMTSTSGGVPQAAVGYFVDQKKGEVNELKQVRILSVLVHPPLFQSQNIQTCSC